MKRAVKSRQVLVWVLSLVVAFSMVCSAASFILPGRNRATPTAIPTVSIPTWTPTSEPSPEPTSTLLVVPGITPSIQSTPTR